MRHKRLSKRMKQNAKLKHFFVLGITFNSPRRNSRTLKILASRWCSPSPSCYSASHRMNKRKKILLNWSSLFSNRYFHIRLRKSPRLVIIQCISEIRRNFLTLTGEVKCDSFEQKYAFKGTSKSNLFFDLNPESLQICYFWRWQMSHYNKRRSEKIQKLCEFECLLLKRLAAYKYSRTL